jgi:hypothetical protein
VRFFLPGSLCYQTNIYREFWQNGSLKNFLQFIAIFCRILEKHILNQSYLNRDPWNSQSGWTKVAQEGRIRGVVAILKPKSTKPKIVHDPPWGNQGNQMEFLNFLI